MNVLATSTWTIGNIISSACSWGNWHGNSFHRCWISNIDLLTGECGVFCYGIQGTYFNNTVPLPLLPSQYAAFINHPNISSLSLILNLIFSFTSIEMTHPFLTVPGPPGFLTIQGCIYHCLQLNHQDSAVFWFLYDSFIHNMVLFEDVTDILPPNWINVLWNALLTYSSLVRGLFHPSILDAWICLNAYLTLADTGTWHNLRWNLEELWSFDKMEQINLFQQSATFGSYLHIPYCFPMELLDGLSMEHMMILGWTELKRLVKLHLIFQHDRLCTIM